MKIASINNLQNNHGKTQNPAFGQTSVSFDTGEFLEMAMNEQHLGLVIPKEKEAKFLQRLYNKNFANITSKDIFLSSDKASVFGPFGNGNLFSLKKRETFSEGCIYRQSSQPVFFVTFKISKNTKKEVKALFNKMFEAAATAAKQL